MAARTSKKGDQQEWILATVVRYYAGRQRYEVEDIDDGEDEEKQPGTRKKYTLPADAIIPMPKSLPDPSKGVRWHVRHYVGIGRCIGLTLADMSIQEWCDYAARVPRWEDCAGIVPWHDMLL